MNELSILRMVNVTSVLSLMIAYIVTMITKDTRFTLEAELCILGIAVIYNLSFIIEQKYYRRKTK